MSSKATQTEDIKWASPHVVWRKLYDDGYRISEKLIRHWAKAGVIPSVKSGRNTVVSLDGILEYMEKQTQSRAEPPVMQAQEVEGIRRIAE